MNMNDTLRYSDLGLPEDILRRKLYGDFEGAVALIDRKLKQELPESLRQGLMAQRELILRLPADYPYTEAQALAKIQEHIPDFTAAELRERIDKGQIDWIYVNGEPRLVRSFYGTLCKTYKDFSARLTGEEGKNHQNNGAKREAMLNRAMEKMKKSGCMTVYSRCRAQIRIRDEAFRPGETVRVHLPIPAACLQQSDIRLLSFSHIPTHVAAEDAPQRTVYWERKLTENEPFWVEYSFVHRAPYTDTSRVLPDAVQPDFDLDELHPHIVFTPYVRMLTAELTRGMDSPMEKAKAIYDFVTLNVRYAYMRAYFGLENIAENCARNLRGDCGVQALLFITLCRCAGIPARWQSGLIAEPEDMGCHDWAMFYVAPQGWMFADCSFGGGAHRAGNEERRQFYFGNLDPYRMVANGAFQAPFDPPKTHWRADPYDSQTGEIEYADRGLREFEMQREMTMLEQKELD